ncbi:MAG: hypothetical protein KF816_05920 [Melioribacteraceae bacterium]|nr:hypothetical protein [Melioribacteraceae bacterium]
MTETILNIYLVINDGNVTAFRAKDYQIDGTDSEKILYLKKNAKNDFNTAETFNAPVNKLGRFMPYKKFSKLESQGMQYRLFEEIFEKFMVPQNPLICVTPVVDGDVWAQNIE